MNVQQALAQAANAIGAVGKNMKMEAGPARYKYRGLDDLIDKVHGPLVEAGVTFSPHSIEMLDTLEKTTKSGSTQYHLRAIVTYRIYGPEGDYIEASVLAEGTDTGDKAGNKLMSGAYKYALGQVLSIPFSMEDQDETLSEPVVKQQITRQEVDDRLVVVAAKLGTDVETVTKKWRTLNKVDMDGFATMAPEAVLPLVVQLEKYAANNK